MIISLQSNYSKNIQFKSNTMQNNNWKEPVRDTIGTALAAGLFLNLDYFTTLKNDSKRIKASKILLTSAIIGNCIYDIAKNFRNVSDKNI